MNSHSWSCLFPGPPHSRPIYPSGRLKSPQRRFMRGGGGGSPDLRDAQLSQARGDFYHILSTDTFSGLRHTNHL